MASKSKNIVKTQYLYVNSKNAIESPPYNVKLVIPARILECDNATQSFKITVQDFQMTASWYYVNETNHALRISYIVDDVVEQYNVVIPSGNYTFKALAAILQSVIRQHDIPNKDDITVTWDATKNKIVFTFPNAEYVVSFQVPNSAGSILGFVGFESQTYTPDPTTYRIISNDILKLTLSENITLWIDNVTINKDYVSIENKSTNVCEPVTCILNIVNNFSPFDKIKFENTNDLYSIIINEKVLDNLVFSIRDENGELMEYVSPWRASIKIETLESDVSYSQQINMVSELKEMREYLKYMFLQGSLRK